MVSICVPAYRQEKTIDQAILSAITQDYTDMEILIIDDCSTDDTVAAANSHPVRLIVNETNLGIGGNLTKCMQEAKGEYIIYLCGDDYFCDTHVVSDMVRIFETHPKVGVIDRFYYQFMDGHPGAIATIRDEILLSSVNPSGMAFRKSAMTGEFSSKIFIECPSMVKNILAQGWHSHKIFYDTIAVRIKPEQNTCTVSSYYTESPILNANIITPGYVNYSGFISLRMRRPQLLLQEILITIKIKPLCLLSFAFWGCVLISILPARVLSHLSNWYRHRIQRRFCVIKSRSR